jgi:hypothetical protein
MQRKWQKIHGNRVEKGTEWKWQLPDSQVAQAAMQAA